MNICVIIFLASHIFNNVIAQRGNGYLQSDEEHYLQDFSSLVAQSYQTPLPPGLRDACKGTSYNLHLETVYINGNTVTSSDVQQICGVSSLCVITSNTTILMNSNFNVGALIVRGSLRWDDTTQHLETQWLCGGFVVIEGGNFFMSVQNVSHNAYIYLKDNSATHNSTLGNRVFGAVNYGAQTPVIGMSGRRLRRTWSLLSIPVTKGSNNISMTHDPIAMGWRVGDRILIASKSDHVSESFRIVSMNSADNRINLDKTTIQSYSAEFLWTGSDSHATVAAEVINLSRNVVITGDDFSTIPCDPSLPLIGTPLTNPAFHLTNPSGCSCLPLIKKTHCTVGLHTGMFGPGLMNMDYIRVEKCGQRGIKGRYCMHMHFLGLSPDSTLKGNAVENSHQRGIVVHETNAATVEENVMSDVRGAGIYVQDGNELWNRFKYNVVICPWNQDKSSGCTVPGTDNPTADSNLDQSAFYAITPSNDLIGNRFQAFSMNWIRQRERLYTRQINLFRFWSY